MEAFMSMITPYGCNFVIRSWGACSGALLSISQFSSLFSLLGTNFGGDGRTSFGLPDLRGRSPVNFGSGPGLSYVAIGQMGGLQNVTLNTVTLPAHTHSVDLTGATAAQTSALTVSTGNAGTNDPEDNYLATTAPTTRIYTDTLSTPAGSQDAIEIPARTASFVGNTTVTGPGHSFDAQSPYQGVNYQICMFGIYPTRS
jgi:microcystin-dependent protein